MSSYSVLERKSGVTRPRSDVIQLSVDAQNDKQGHGEITRNFFSSSIYISYLKWRAKS